MTLLVKRPARDRATVSHNIHRRVVRSSEARGTGTRKSSLQSCEKCRHKYPAGKADASTSARPIGAVMATADDAIAIAAANEGTLR